ncbi:MAG: putative porin [Novosphingobium sp.]|nr:putative porin [Novosphingobium sp.]
MIRAKTGGRYRLALVAAGLLAGTVLAPACAAAQAADPAGPAAPQPSGNAMVNLVRLLVAQGTITQENGDKLIAQALAEAEQANAAARAAQAVPGTAAGAGAAAVAAAGGGTGAGTATAMAPPPKGTIRVPYIPQVVRDQIRDELRADVMKQAKAEGWASPEKSAPEWTERLRLFGDFRIRSQTNLFSKFNTTQAPNFQAIVAAGPLDLINNQIPFVNTTTPRYNQLRYRFRLGVEARVADGIKANVQLASGNDINPVATASNLGGGFFKRNIYLQQAFIEAQPAKNVTLRGGRFENPFWTSEILYDNDINFDGFAAEVRFPQRLFGALDWTVRGGAFPLDFGGSNFPDTATSKISPAQRWLFAGQIQGNLHLAGRTELTFAAGYNKFLNIRGRPSEPCALYLGVTQCSTDTTAAFFVQRGNSLSFIRRIVLDPTLPSTTVQAQPQLLGLTQPFGVLNVRGQLSFPLKGDNRVFLSGDYVRNLAFRKSYACRYGQAGQPVNNGGSGGSGNICDPDVTKRTPYVGGNEGFSVSLELGRREPWNFGEWRVFGEYRSVESDAVLDAFNNDEFHLGGTNARGFILGTQAGLFHNTNLQVRWFSTNQISGEPIAIDEVQVDLNVRF